MPAGTRHPLGRRAVGFAPLWYVPGSRPPPRGQTRSRSRGSASAHSSRASPAPIISRERPLPPFSPAGPGYGGRQEQAPHQGRQEGRQEESVRAAGRGGDGVLGYRAGRRGGRMPRMRDGWRRAGAGAGAGGCCCHGGGWARGELRGGGSGSPNGGPGRGGHGPRPGCASCSLAMCPLCRRWERPRCGKRSATAKARPELRPAPGSGPASGPGVSFLAVEAAALGWWWCRASSCRVHPDCRS